VSLVLSSVVCLLSLNRWKGENVATSEVADILTMARCILEANVYGVKVEGKNTTDTTRSLVDVLGEKND